MQYARGSHRWHRAAGDPQPPPAGSHHSGWPDETPEQHVDFLEDFNLSAKKELRVGTEIDALITQKEGDKIRLAPARRHPHEVLSWDTEPGDIIIHHPNTVHGSAGNVSESRRRLSSSIRYLGDDVRWRFKANDVKAREVKEVPGSSEAFGRALLDVAREDQKKGYTYLSAVDACYVEMRDGEAMDARECARTAFPVVWRRGGGPGAVGKVDDFGFGSAVVAKL